MLEELGHLFVETLVYSQEAIVYRGFQFRTVILDNYKSIRQNKTEVKIMLLSFKKACSIPVEKIFQQLLNPAVEPKAMKKYNFFYFIS